MINEVRRKDREIDVVEAKKILAESNFGVLSMNGREDGYAYGVPISYVFTGTSIYFHCAVEGRKLLHIMDSNKVCFCVVGQAETQAAEFSVRYKSAIAFGKITDVDGQEKFDALISFVKKYSSDFITEGTKYAESSGNKTRVLRLDIESVTGKSRK